MGLAYKNVIYTLCLLLTIVIVGIIDSFEAIAISLLILLTYLAYKPKFLLHPNNLIFAFSGLYVVFPTFVYFYIEFNNIEYILPWGKLYDWSNFSKSTYYGMLYMFVIPFFSFRYFTRYAEKVAPTIAFEKIYIKTSTILIICVLASIFLMIFISKTGGLLGWIYNYQYTYLALREGNGLINFLTIFLVNLFVLIMGIKLFQKKRSNLSFFLHLIAIFVVILLFSYFQGLKSRFIILSIFLFFPILIGMRLPFSKLLIFIVIFFGLMAIGNYIRSDGFYDSGDMLFEYSLTYLNAYPIHDMILGDYDPDFFQTIHHIFIKPLIIVGLVSPDTEFDLSIMLTKIYFPNDWLSAKATQQWPLLTELHLNYYGILFGWIPLVLYSYVISLIYNRLFFGNLALSLIYLLEMFRIFSTFRGVLLPWNLPWDIFTYILYFYILKMIIKKRTLHE